MKKLKKINSSEGLRKYHKPVWQKDVENLNFEYLGKGVGVFRIDNKTKKIIPIDRPHGLIVVPANEFNDIFEVGKNYKINGKIVHLKGFEKAILFADEYEEVAEPTQFKFLQNQTFRFTNFEGKS